MLEGLARARAPGVIVALLWSASGCSAEPEGGDGTGGTAAGSPTGGSVSTGGNLPAGGHVATGGSFQTGGGPATGGSVSTGGLTTGGSGVPGGSGGTLATGGVVATTGGLGAGGTGGANLTGGAGTTGGALPTGGMATTGGAGVATGGAGSSGSFAITGLTIEANPNNVLAAHVSWTTAQPADSVVQFGEGQYRWEVSDPALVTNHRVLIIGMHASSTYQVGAFSSAGGQTVSASATHATGSLPVSIPVGQVTVNDTSRTSPGWTLMNVQMGDGNSMPTSDYPAQAVMYDSDGQPVWYHINGSSPDYGGAVSVELTDQGVLFGPVGSGQGLTAAEPPREVDFGGNVIWECLDEFCGKGEGDLSHHAGKLANGNYVVMHWMEEDQDSWPVVDEIRPDQSLVGSWDFRQFVPKPADATGDWCHGNAATVDAANDAVYLSCRWMGLIKVTYNNPSLVWHLPASYGAEGLGTLQFSPSESQFTDIHDPEIHDDGTILFFDNGGWEVFSTGEEVLHSRAVEYQIDANAGTATLVWEFPGNFNVDAWYRDEWYQPFWGDADRVANGNVLVTAGERGSESESRVFEVSKADGQVVWEFRLGPDVGVYRAERITPPLVRAIDP